MNKNAEQAEQAGQDPHECPRCGDLKWEAFHMARRHGRGRGHEEWDIRCRTCGLQLGYNFHYHAIRKITKEQKMEIIQEGIQKARHRDKKKETR